MSNPHRWPQLQRGINSGFDIAKEVTTKNIWTIVKCPIVGQPFRVNSPCKAPLTPGGGGGWWGNTLIGALVASDINQLCTFHIEAIKLAQCYLVNRYIPSCDLDIRPGHG